MILKHVVAPAVLFAVAGSLSATPVTTALPLTQGVTVTKAGWTDTYSLAARNGTANSDWSKIWVQFDLSSIPQEATLLGASLQFTLQGNSGAFPSANASIPLTLYTFDSSWTDAATAWNMDSTTWNTVPGNDTNSGNGVLSTLIPVAQQTFQPTSGLIAADATPYSFSISAAGIDRLSHDQDHLVTFVLTMGDSNAFPSFVTNGVGAASTFDFQTSLAVQHETLVPEPVCFMSLASVSLGLLLRKRQPVAR